VLTQFANALVTSITNLYTGSGLLGIVLIMALESCFFPLPASEVIIPIAGALVTRGSLLPGVPFWASITLVSLASTLGCLIGSMIVYAIGYAGGRQMILKYGRYLLITQHDAERADQFFLRWGNATVFYARLLPVVRTWASLPAGVTRMPFRRFCLYTFSGSLLWCVLWTCLGAFLGNDVDQLKPISGTLTMLVLVLSAALIVLYIRSRVRAIQRDRVARFSEKIAS
jgi:membrane protein DedA with SNARE-associated domain